MHSSYSAYLQHLSIPALNPMQEAFLAKPLDSQHLMLLSPTGSGKTLAFLLRMLAELEEDKKGIQAIIIAPARELVLQIEDVLRKMKTGYNVCVCYGGHHSRTEQNRLAEGPAIVIGTPGRLSDHIQKGTIDAFTVKMVVLDEFDKSLQMGFHEQLEVIFRAFSGKQKHLLTSATRLEEIPSFIPFKKADTLDFLKKEENVRLQLQLVKTAPEEKIEVLLQLISSFGTEVSLVFCNHRDAVDRISAHFKEMGFANAVFHGAMEQIDRERNLIRFRSGACHVLISTDLAARGLDIPEIRHVVHYQLPIHEDAFIHRNGRTARMHAEGQAYLILADDETMPAYIPTKLPVKDPGTAFKLPPAPAFECVYFSAGKKEKISKGDIVGLLMKKGGLANGDIGVISITDLASFVGIKRSLVPSLLKKLKGEKLKKAKVKVEVAR